MLPAPVGRPVCERFNRIQKKFTTFIFSLLNPSRMSSIREIREFAGLSHKQLAEWLGVSKSLVWYAETGGRSLPQAALLKLGAMTVLIQGLKNERQALTRPGERRVGNPGKLAARHKKKEAFHRSSAAALQVRLNTLRKKHPQLDARLALFEALRNKAPHWYRVTDVDTTWMELTEWFTRDRMPLTGLEQQELLQDKIDTHLASAELHRQQREKYEGMEGVLGNR